MPKSYDLYAGSQNSMIKPGCLFGCGFLGYIIADKW